MATGFFVIAIEAVFGDRDAVSPIIAAPIAPIGSFLSKMTIDRCFQQRALHSLNPRLPNVNKWFSRNYPIPRGGSVGESPPGCKPKGKMSDLSEFIGMSFD